MSKKKKELKRWSVRYESIYEGDVEVEAETAEEAWAIGDAGDYEDQPGAARVNWKALGGVSYVREVR